jgi:hypothetical protein
VVVVGGRVEEGHEVAEGHGEVVLGGAAVEIHRRFLRHRTSAAAARFDHAIGRGGRGKALSPLSRRGVVGGAVGKMPSASKWWKRGGGGCEGENFVSGAADFKRKKGNRGSACVGLGMTE